jgi:hypothetical protein
LRTMEIFLVSFSSLMVVISIIHDLLGSLFHLQQITKRWWQVELHTLSICVG